MSKVRDSRVPMHAEISINELDPREEYLLRMQVSRPGINNSVEVKEVYSNWTEIKDRIITLLFRPQVGK